MGGGSYDFDVATQSRTSNNDAFSYEGYEMGEHGAGARRGPHPTLDPKGNIRECMNELPIVVALDVTRSRGDDSRVMYEKLPMFIGQLEVQGYVPGAAISFAAIGDADSDLAPLQVGQFEADNRLDEVLSRFWLEEGGGGTGQESYELAAYFYAHHSVLAAHERGEKGFFFFVGDEGFYPKVSREHIEQVLGREVEEDVDALEAFAALQDKYEVFFILPRQSWQERQRDIDAEIRQRVLAAGGQYDDVDVRASLMWNNRNDLDLHVIAPSGERIFYQHKKSACGGWLDVDMNVRGETLKPVENIRWRKGEAPAGTYEVRVQNFRFHEGNTDPTPYEIELEVNGEVQRFKGIVSPNGELQARSEILVHTFEYDPDARPASDRELAARQDAYANYDDEVIRAQWAEAIGEDRILSIEDPRAIIDVMLGAMAITAGTQDVDAFIADMESREQSAARREMVRTALGPLSARRAMTRSSVSGELPKLAAGAEKTSATKRLE